MSKEIEQVLANWIDEALSPMGKLPAGTSPAEWVAGQFLTWWRCGFQSQVGGSLDDADRSLQGIQSELNRLGGWALAGEALHECIHLRDTLNELRRLLVPDKT